MTSALFKAAGEGNKKALHKEMKKRVNVNAFDPQSYVGNSALIIAARGGHLELVKDLLTAGAIVGLKNKAEETALTYAVRNRHPQIVAHLISSGAPVNQKNKKGKTPLMVAGFNKTADILKLLLVNGAQVDIQDIYGDTALIIAARSGNTQVVDELLHAGASIDISNKEGETALALAEDLLYEEIVELLNEASRIRELEFQEQQVLPQLPEIASGKEMIEETDSSIKMPSPSGFPLLQNASYPEVTFFDDPQEKHFTSSGGHADFENGLEITIPPHVDQPGASTSVTVQPSLAPSHVFVLPHDIHSASPSYLIKGKGPGLADEVTLTIEHHVNVKKEEDANNLLFLHADATPTMSDSKSLYEYKEVPEAKVEFDPKENKGRLTTRLSHNKFFRVGFRKRFMKLFGRSKVPVSDLQEAATNVTEPPVPNLYTVRLYNSSPHTSVDRIAIVGVSLYGRFYTKFLEAFDTVVIPRDYPEVSSKAVDRTTVGPVCFTDHQARLTVISEPAGWIVNLDKETISKSGVDLPETNTFRLEELHDYPPKIVCRFYPGDHSPPIARCTLSFVGFNDEVQFHIALEAPRPGRRLLDTRKLDMAAEKLKSTTTQLKETELTPAVKIIITLMGIMSTALRSSSLGDLATHTDSIKTNVQTVLKKASKKVIQVCFIQSIKADIEASVQKVESLSHQLCHVTKVKLTYCQDSSEEAAALDDLVNNGANLLQAVDYLLNLVHTFDEISKNNVAYNVLVHCGNKIVGEFTKEPTTLAVSLHAANFISDRTLEETNELNETKRNKATRLYTTILKNVAEHPHKYPAFISILQEKKVLYRHLLEDLELTRKQLSMHSRLSYCK